MNIDPGEISQDLVLVGGGHAHALALRMLAMRPVAGVRITLVSPASHTPYSGMLPGLVAGHYSFEDAHIDLARLCQWAGVRFLCAEAVGLDPARKTLFLKDRPSVTYDFLSIDIGSQPELDSVPGARKWATPVKPVSQLWQRSVDLSVRLGQQTNTDNRKVVVVGGGAGSVELVLAMAQRFRNDPVHFTLVCGGPDILNGYNTRARASIARVLDRYEITQRMSARVTRVESGQLELDNGATQAFDELFWCTGAAAAPWLADSGLATDEQGFLSISDTLQVRGCDNVFAVGDVATQFNHPRPKAGVYAVRQGPVLAHNLIQILLGRELKSHRPQRQFLSLVSLGGREATADRGIFSWTSNGMWRWKDHIDRAFMSRFDVLPERMQEAASRADDPHESVQMPCGGCGAKVGADTLRRVLVELAGEYPDVCPAGGQAEDTAPIPESMNRRIVQSVDVLREIVADPWVMGRIAANHALSDLYASGAEPLSALATITLPFAVPAVLERELKQVLAGALHEFAAVDCKLSGGHSLQGSELNVGFVVNGSAMCPEQGLLGKRDLNPGDRLLLTKPLGTGTLFAGHMLLQADGRDVQAAVDMMLQSNAQAGRLAVEYGASAATDVTGFGLVGHLLEMLGESYSARLSTNDVPLLPGALRSICNGVFSTMHAANTQAKRYLAGRNDRVVDQARVELLLDPQTSGGLLIAVSPEKSEPLRKALCSLGYEYTTDVGEIVHSPAGQPAGQIVLE